MDKCPKCGNKLSPVDVLCPRCGALVEKVQASYSSPAENAENSYARSAPADLPPEAAMTRQGRKEALRARQAQEEEALRAAKKRKEKNWLEIEEIGPASQSTDDAPAVIAAVEPASEEVAAHPAEEAAAAPYEAAPPDSTPRRLRNRPRDEKTQTPVATPAEPRNQKTRNHAPAFLVLFIWILTTVAVFAGFYFTDAFASEAYGSRENFIRQITGGKIDLDISASYLNSIKVDISEVQTDDGEPAHHFEISMADGKSIRVLPLGDTYQMENGSVSFTVSDEAIAQSLGIMTSEDSMETSGVSFDVETASQTFSYPIASLTLRLTNAAYEREKPSSDTSTTTSSAMNIVLAVSPDATVFINNTNYTSNIGQNGQLSVTMPLEVGDNSFVAEAIQSGYRSVTDTFTVTRKLPETLLTLNDEYLRVFDYSFECIGTSESGATVTASLDGREFTALAGVDGSFTIPCSLENTGVYEMEVTASIEGLADSVSTVTVESLPAQETFMESAKVLTVEKIVNDFDSLKDTGIKAEGTISDITSNIDKQAFVLTSGDTTLNCYYYGSQHLSVNLTYTFYGMVDTDQNSFYVMFVE